METKQTAVDWLIDELGEYFPHEIGGIHLMVKQAKQMEKEQMIEFTDKVIDNTIGDLILLYSVEKIYNETYGK
jgi:hypothetical protein